MAAGNFKDEGEGIDVVRGRSRSPRLASVETPSLHGPEDGVPKSPNCYFCDKGQALEHHCPCQAKSWTDVIYSLTLFPGSAKREGKEEDRAFSSLTITNQRTSASAGRIGDVASFDGLGPTFCSISAFADGEGSDGRRRSSTVRRPFPRKETITRSVI